MKSVPGAVATGLSSGDPNRVWIETRSHPPPHAGCPRGDPVATAPGTDSVLVIDSGRSRRQPSINPRHALRQRKHVVDDRVPNVAVEIAQLTLRFAIDGDAERRDPLRLCLAQSLARVFAGITRVAVIMIVRTAI